MKNNYRMLAAFAKMFDLDLFYAITLYSGDWKCQAHYSSDLVRQLLKARFKNDGITDNGYTMMRRGRIEIVLT